MASWTVHPTQLQPIKLDKQLRNRWMDGWVHMGMPQTNASAHQFMAQLMPFWGSHWQISYVLETPHTVTSADSLINFLQFNQCWVCFYWYLLWSVPCCWSPCSLACHKWTWKSGEAQEQSHATKYELLLVLKLIYCPICSYFYMWYNVKDCFTGGPFYKPFSFVLLVQELWLSQPNTVSDTICNVR